MRWTLVGRTTELAHATSLIESTERGGGVLLAGPAGVGKSRLAAEIADLAANAGFHVERIAASTATQSVPFGAFSHLVPQVTAADRLQLLQMTRSSLRRNAGERRLAILVDDAQRLDEGSMALVHLLGSSGDAFLILTTRTTDPTPESLIQLWKDDYVERIELAGLPSEATDAIVSEALPSATTGAKRTISELAGGNPLLLKELIIEGQHSGALRLEGDAWVVTGDFGRLPRLVDLVEARLEGLSSGAKTLLEALAVGSPLPVAVVERLDDDRVLPELRRAELVTRDGDTMALAHPVYGEVLRAGLAGLHLDAIRDRLAGELLNEPDRTPANVLRAASWRLESGTCTPDLAIDGATFALAIFDGALAERFAEVARNHDDSWLPQSLLARSFFVQQKSAEAEAAFAHVSLPVDDPEAVGRIAWIRALNLAFGLGDPIRAKQVLTDAAGLVTGPPSLALLADRALFDALLGDFHAVITAGGPLIDDPEIDSFNRLRALISYTLAQGMCARLERFDEFIDLGARLAEEHRTVLPMARVQIGLNRAFGLAALGRLDEAIERITAGHELALEEDGVVALWGGQRGGVLLQAGLLDEAAAVLRSNQSYMIDFDPFRTNPMHLAFEAVVLAIAGRSEDAQQVLDRAERETTVVEPRFKVHAERARAWLAVHRGDLDAATEALTETGEEAVKATHILWGCEVLHDVVRLGRPERVLDQLRSVVTETVDAPYIDTMASHAAALEAKDPAALEPVAAQFRAQGARLLAAEAMAQAAAALHATGNQVAGTRAATVSMRWQADCGDVSTPALLVRPSALSGREFEVADLVARGLSSRDAAERLFLSVRTVDNHLRSVYRKLDLDGREHLAEFWNAGKSLS